MIMASWIRAVCAAAAVALWFGSLTFAQAPSPVGRWRSFDDKTGQPKSIIEITEVNGELQGTVERVFSPPAPSLNPLCELCTGDRKNKPIVGMQMLWGMKKEGDEYGGGRILQPETGKELRGKLKVIDGGKKLEVRGFVGLAFVGRTVTWARE
jgi:uncharacterized protein (DUF2147 family)